ncbi:MAG TPA: glycoside hydrolase family 9 protein [Chitinophagaceae bacterium]|nr:glycoside hydrolase family 9 protein [Chitinophagaceae bacterium]
MRSFLLSLLILISFCFNKSSGQDKSWIRINQLGYTPQGIKVAVWCSKNETKHLSFSVVDSASGKTVFTNKPGKNFGAYGPFKITYRLNFSSFKRPGVYFLKAGNTVSPFFKIDKDVYKGAADFCLQYMRQQRSGYNPYLKDSCHTHDGYTLYGPMQDSTHIDVVGGWHDASDYLQYSTTSANATYHLLMAYRDFKNVFTDEKLANGLDGKNGMADVLDEAKWGLEWLLKMHPKEDWMFNQIADDRDHMGMRIPKQDSFYGRGYERPVYFVSGEPQQRGKFMNNTTGTSSIAAKFSSAFSLGSAIFANKDLGYSMVLMDRSASAAHFATKKPGVSQTASVRSPYIYAEDNWTDDMELAFASASLTFNGMLKKFKVQLEESPDGNLLLDTAFMFAQKEKITPWLGADTAKHYQWYPFINLGHYELAKQLKDKRRDSIIGYYKTGIERVWNKAKNNAFYRGVPFIWCSNNLTTSFAIQCYWYRELTNDKTYAEFEQANIDWLFGCNPWGTSMVYGLPSWGDTPVDPHSAFTHLKNYPIKGGLVDGPVYTSIYKGLIGITLKDADEYAEFQSDLAVYHDDYGDYSSNEPTMDGTASLVYLLAAKENEASPKSPPVEGTSAASFNTVDHGAIVRGDQNKKQIALVFTADEFGDGAKTILNTLQKQNVKASFFFTGRFYRNPVYKNVITQLKQQGHYLGPHSDQHLLYADWTKRDSLLVTKDQFTKDLSANLKAIEKYGVKRSAIKYFIPPYEWYNDSIAAWTKQMGIQLINYSAGTKSTADYTTPEMKNYRSSDEIYQSILNKEKQQDGLNGFILLVHFGTDAKRTDKFYYRLDELLTTLKQKGYSFTTVDKVLK